MFKKKFAVVIGRFQPFHLGHYHLVKSALEVADTVIVVFGSANVAPDVKNPWSVGQRQFMVEGCFTEQEVNQMIFLSVNDYMYNEQDWITEVQQLVNLYAKDNNETCLVGYRKDTSSYYLDCFPQWDFITVDPYNGIYDGTIVRNLYFSRSLELTQKYLPQSVYTFLEGFKANKIYESLCQEYAFILAYKEATQSKAGYPPFFNTVDAIVIKSGHVLVVKRKSIPGKGLFALPGGFINEKEQIETAMLRELREETGIKVDKAELRKCIKRNHVFADPNRSLRGRTITHAYFIDLGNGELPYVKGSDDAEKAWWMPLKDLDTNQANFFEDHIHIIRHFI